MAIDDNTVYGLTGAQLKELPGKIEAVKGLAKALTADDYNANKNDWTDTDPANFNCIALWKLDAGVYSLETGLSGTKPLAYFAVRRTITNNGPIWIGEGRNGDAATRIYLYKDGDWIAAEAWHETGAVKNEPLALHVNVINNVTSTSSTSALSASQGKFLNDKIDARIGKYPTAPTSTTVGTLGQLWVDTTTFKTYMCTDASNPFVWEEVGGGSGVTELTSADYNYDHGATGTNNTVGLWLLDPGVYYAEIGVKVFPSTSGGHSYGGTFIVGERGTSIDERTIIEFSGRYNSAKMHNVAPSDGTLNSTKNFSGPNVVQTTGTSTADVMSQNAVTSMIFADPSVTHRVRVGTAETVGDHSTSLGETSQAYGNGAVALGYSAKAYSQGGVAIGRDIEASGTNAYGSIALGAYSGSNITAPGMMDIGVRSSYTNYGYNNSNYRLLTGIYDPQGDHDAATKGYVDTAVASVDTPDAFTNSEWDTLWA